jgi:hypothetical protein
VTELAPDRQHDIGRRQRRDGKPAIGQHAVPEGMPLVHGAAAHDRRDHRRCQPVRDRAQLARGVGGDDAATCNDQRPRRGREQARRLRDVLHVARRARAAATAA